MVASTAAPEPLAAPIHQVNDKKAPFTEVELCLDHKKRHSLHIAHHLQLVLICAFSMNARWAGGLP